MAANEEEPTLEEALKANRAAKESVSKGKEKPNKTEEKPKSSESSKAPQPSVPSTPPTTPSTASRPLSLAAYAIQQGRKYGCHISARIVYEGDDFIYAQGLEPVCTHVPKDHADPVVSKAYAIARYPGGWRTFEVIDAGFYAPRLRADEDVLEQLCKFAIQKLVAGLPEAPNA